MIPIPSADVLVVLALVGAIYFAGLGVVRGVEAVAHKTKHAVVWVAHHLGPARHENPMPTDPPADEGAP